MDRLVVGPSCGSGCFLCLGNRQAINRIWSRCLAGSSQSCLAGPQGSGSDHCLRFWFRVDHGYLFVADETTVAEPSATSPVNPDLRWYVGHAYSGMEKAVERNILERIARADMQSKFGRILVPMEEVVEVKNGQKKTTERKFFPGYVLVEMVIDDDTWHLIKHTNKVTGFVGGAKNRPAPISEAEVLKIVMQMQEGTDKPRHKVEFVVGEFVRVKEGPFTDFNGSVEDVNYEKSKVRVSVTIFGRSTPVELEFSQIEKT